MLAGATANALISGWVGNTSKQEGLTAISDCVIAIGACMGAGWVAQLSVS